MKVVWCVLPFLFCEVVCLGAGQLSEVLGRVLEGTVSIRTSSGERKGVGSGAIVDERGYAVTCHHVVAGWDRIQWSRGDREPRGNVDVVATNAALDLALIRLREAPRSVPALRLGRSEDLSLTEDVYAVGAPFGFDNSVSGGILSAFGAKITVGEDLRLDHLLQTDIALNLGNSGGPLVTKNGTLVGINVAMNEAASRVSFAISGETVRRFLEAHLPPARD